MELIEIFLDDYPHYLEQLGAAIESGDDATLAREAHNLKGAAGTMALREVQALCLALEEMIQGQQMEQAPQTLARLAAES